MSVSNTAEVTSATQVVPLRPGELAALTGVSVRSLRYYEEQRLVLPARTSGGQRRYHPDDVARVRLVQQLFAAGLTSSDVVEILPCIYSGTTTPAMIERLHHERARIDRQATDLAATRDRLDEVILEAHRRLVTDDG